MRFKQSTVAAGAARVIASIALVMTMSTSPHAAGSGGPESFDRTSLLPVEQVDLRIMPFVDVQTLLAADEDSPIERSRFPMKVDFSPGNSGNWESLPGGDEIWRLRVESPGAFFTVLGFDQFELQEGAVLHLYNPSRSSVLGGFTSDHIRGNGKLWSTSIDGDVAIVELYWPASLSGQTPALHLGTVSHVYRSIEPARGVDECSPDVNCPLGLNIDVVQRGAVRLYIGELGAICSGSLINNVRNDGTPYVLTAEHCVAAALDANPGDDLSSSEILFNFERPGCGPPPDSPPDDDRLTGLTLRSMWDVSDVALLELDDSVPASFCARLNGWSRSTVSPNQTGTIHQPAGGAPKKVSVDFDPPVLQADYWKIEEWEIGNTRSGSSGAPLFNQAGRIIGQLCCGELSGVDPPECRQDLNDKFGRMDLSWNGGGSSSTRLKDWLDPDNTNAITHYGMEAADNGNCFGNYANHDVGNLRITVTNQGILGFMDGSQSEGVGFIYPFTGSNLLFTGSLWVAESPSYVANRDYDADPAKEWMASTGPDGQVVVDYNGTSDADIHAAYTDDGGAAPRGLYVRQESWAFADGDRDDSVIVRYFIENRGTATLADLYVGLFADFDIGTSAFDEGAVETSQLMAYMHSDGVYAGVRLLNGTAEPDGLANLTLIRNQTYVWPDGYVIDRHKFGFLANNGPEYNLPVSDTADDYSVQVSAGPFNLRPGEVNEVAFAVVGGESLESLLTNAANAQETYILETGGETSGIFGDLDVSMSAELMASLPNPFSAAAQTAIHYNVKAPGSFQLSIYNASGQKVRTLADGTHASGTHNVVWDGTNDRGHELGSGIYFVRLATGAKASTRRIVMLD